MLKCLTHCEQLLVLMGLSQFEINEAFSGMDPECFGFLAAQSGSGLLHQERPNFIKFQLNESGFRIQTHVNQC